ncbi:MAG: ABC transporter substrate-binding protein, partial [Rhodospirillales bacterium]|nr:ABC transporter substrate-binding protein [Rhodospirillales bacterium]
MGFRAALAAALLMLTGVAVPAAAQSPKPTHGIAMHGAPKYGPDFTHFDYVNPNAPKGGELHLSALRTFNTFNPYVLRGDSAAGLGDLFETLMIGSEDEAFSEYGLLAETIQVPKDRSWVAFTLRPEARWHDGKPVTVEDVIWSLNTLRAKGRPFYRFYYRDVVKSEKTGPRTVKFTFKNTTNRELPLILGQLPILPKHFWASRDFEKTLLEAPLGSGPYRIKSFEAGRSITYERVKDYWGKDIPVNKGRYNSDIIRYDYYRDATVALEAFKSGDYDFRSEDTSKVWATGYDSPPFRKGLYKTEEIRHEIPTGMQGFVFNTRKELFKDKRVRRALAFAFDFEWTNKNLFYGQYARTNSYFSNSELAASGLPSPAELEILNKY